MTSPRTTKTKRAIFNTPQLHRAKSFNLVTEVVDSKIDTSASVLHRVRARNTRQHEQKPIKRGHIFDDEDEEEDGPDYQAHIQNENKAPSLMVILNMLLWHFTHNLSLFYTEISYSEKAQTIYTNGIDWISV